MNNYASPLIKKTKKTDIFFIKSDSKYYPLALNDISWISASGNYCTIHTDTAQTYELRISLAKIKPYLSGGTFVQINKKDLINTCNIKMYDPLGVVLVGTQEFSVSRRFKKTLENSLQFLP